MTDYYDGSRPYVGANFTHSKKPGTGRKWRTDEDRKRVKGYEENWSIFLGKHWSGNGGPWPHPYGPKGLEEGIPYQQINIMAKAVKAFRDLIFGDGIIVQSESPRATEILENVKLKNIKQALIFSGVYGFCGIQPFKNEKNAWEVLVVKPNHLYPEFSKVNPNKLVKVRKCIPYLQVDLPTGGTIDLLYEETHYMDRVETRLYHIAGEEIVKEIDLQFFKLIDEDEVAKIAPLWQHNHGDFLVTLLFNEKIHNEMLSDYTISAKHTQQALNERLTQIDRVLKLHSNPKLMVPKGAFDKDPETGRWYWMHQDSEVLVQDPNDPNPNQYAYLTWDGQLTASVNRRDNLIFSLCTEMDISPQLLSFTNLVSGTTAETAEKLKQMLIATVKRAEGKREEAWESIEKLIINIFKLSNVDEEFSITFPELFPRTRQEILEEVGFRKDRDLITTKDSLIILDDLTEEEADKKTAEIFNEKENALPNPYNGENIPPRYFAPVNDDETEEEEEIDNAAIQ